MTIFDIIILVTTLAFVIAGLVKGFIKTLLGLGATLLAIVIPLRRKKKKKARRKEIKKK